MKRAAMPPKPPSKTQPGLGSLPRMDSAEMKRVRESFRSSPPESERVPVTPPAVEVQKKIRDSIRREDPGTTRTDKTERLNDAPAAPRSDRPKEVRRSTVSWENEAPTGTRRKRNTNRPPVSVDEVGPAAVKLARKSSPATRTDSAPKLIASRATIAKAPIDTRSAFIMSLIDGRNTVDALVDMSGMPEDEVKGILDRLVRLGLISA